MVMTYVVKIVIILCSTLIFVIYRKWCFKYWARKNIPYIEPHFIWGNIDNQLRITPGVSYDIKCAYNEFRKRGERHGGMYLLSEAVYVPTDPDLIKDIMAKDFQYFNGRGLLYHEEKDPLVTNLIFLSGNEWKKLRVKLTPTFTSNRIKRMFDPLLNCSVVLIEHVEKLLKNDKSLDVKETFACFTIDVISSCVFGFECDCLQNPDSDFRKYGRMIFVETFYNKLIRFILLLGPKINHLIYFRQVPKDLETFFIKTIKEMLDYRTTNNVKGNDFLQLLMELNAKALETGEKPLTLKQITAQAFLFFLAGFETSSTTMSFFLHEVSFNQDIQDKLREEVTEVINKDGRLTYDGVMNMKYMDKVINETLRKYPPIPKVSRVCNTTYKVSNTGMTLDVGTRVFLSILGLHWDEEYYPNPRQFNAERFTEENAANRPAFTFLPFGEGPRMCIGVRFGLMQMKTGLAMFLNNYRVFPAKNQSYDLNIDFGPMTTSIRDPLLLNIEKIL